MESGRKIQEMIESPQLSRRALISGSAALSAATSLPMPLWARGADLKAARKGFGVLEGEDIRLEIRHSHFTSGGRGGHAIAINGSIPGPMIRLRERQNVRLHVTNG